MTIPRPGKVTILITILACAIGWESRSPVVTIEVFCVFLLVREGFTRFIEGMES